MGYTVSGYKTHSLMNVGGGGLNVTFLILKKKKSTEMLTD